MKTENAPRPFITLDRVSFRLGARVVFPRTDWIVGADEQWALLGGNGSGKSVLALGLMGAIPVIHGELMYHFTVCEGESPEQRIAWVSFERQRELAGESVAAARWFSLEQEACESVRELLSFERVEEINPFEVKDYTVFRRVFERQKIGVVRFLGIRPLLDRQLVQLSNGEMRKILIARALLKNPRLLILDDPFAGLDAEYRVKFHQLINVLIKNAGIQVLLTVSHEDDLPTGITHIALVDRCRMIAQGPRTEMLNHTWSQNLLKPIVPVPFRPLKMQTAAPVRELIHLERASIIYGKRVILNDLTWTVREGESWAVLGRNGAGKSALLALISGNSPQAYANEIHLFGRRRGTGETREWIRKRIGEVSPELHLHFNDALTVLETVLTGFTDSLVLTEHPSAARCRAARAALRQFSLLSQADIPLRGLSAGYQRLALLARALVKKPVLLLLDEPCQGLDARHRGHFMNVLQHLVSSRKTTVLLTTHRADEIPPGMTGTVYLTVDGPVVELT